MSCGLTRFRISAHPSRRTIHGISVQTTQPVISIPCHHSSLFPPHFNVAKRHILHEFRGCRRLHACPVVSDLSTSTLYFEARMSQNAIYILHEFGGGRRLAQILYRESLYR
ncbi:hypothetical protein AVEN_267247-1 [Araneus ventricosus]|uniref:Uncharacterized protein n=1 Tax=Araneus ventricosus TaxID=182803 RepID=A0A4Y2X4A2_ARAVE|nr:hypothetical protein AVEN_267247-1 [Araneus ventricosus]